MSAIFFGVAIIVGVGLPANAGLTDSIGWWVLPLACLLCAAGNYWMGMRFNRHEPQEKFDAYIADIDARIDHSLQQGTFSMGVGFPPPRSMAEAQEQAQQAKQQARREGKRMFNQHTLFFIPMQHWTWIILAFAVLMTVVSFTS